MGALIQKAAEEHKPKIQEQAYLLWEADGKPEGKDGYYWKLAVDNDTASEPKEPPDCSRWENSNEAD